MAMSDIDRAELRRLLAEVTPGPWVAEGSQVWGPDGVLVAAVRELDALDVAESAIERVRALHYAANSDYARTPLCEECQGRAGVHPCGCWAEKDRQPVCGHCNVADLGQRVPWPCPTIQVLDERTTK